MTDKPHLVIGLLGHLNHGKSTLLAAMYKVILDRNVVVSNRSCLEYAVYRKQRANRIGSKIEEI